MAVLESAAWEMSEPGTGPAPAYEDFNADKSIANGWRKGSPPAAYPGHEDPFVGGQYYGTGGWAGDND
jgi:hypothetical protein